MATTLQKVYADLDLTFTRNPVTGDVSIRYDDQAVIASIRNLLLTNFYERPFQPLLGSNIDAYLFEPASAITASNIENEVRDVIKNFEPRASIVDVKVVSLEDSNSFFIELTILIGNNTSPSTVNLLLQRTR